MTATALSLNNEFYLTQASGEVETKSQQGGVTSFVAGSNGDSASATSHWIWNKTYCPSWVYSDLQAVTVQTPSVSVIAAESDTDHLRGYTVSSIAENSLHTKSRVFNYARDVDVKAGMVNVDGTVVAKWTKIRR